MLPTLINEHPEGDNWHHEIKFDGYRTQIHVANGLARALSRRGHDWSDKYRRMVEAAAGLPVDSAVLDVEVIIEDARGLGHLGAR